MVDDEDILVLSGGDVPSSAEELDRIGRAHTAGQMQGKMQIEQFFIGSGSEFGALFCEGFVPGFVRSEAGGAMFVLSIVLNDLGGQELIGVLMSLDFFIGKESYQPLLQGAEEPFDFAFSLRGRGHPMIDADRGQGALELGEGIQAVGCGGVAEKAQAIGIEVGWAAVAFEAGPQEAEVTPGGIGLKAGGHDFACMIIGGEDQRLESVSGPPSMRGRIVLEEFASGGGFPPAPRFGAWRALADQLGIMLLNVLSHRGA